MKAQLEDLVQTRLPTKNGEFILHYYSNTLDDKEHMALVKGDITHRENVPVRIHSECFTGDVLGSRRCDCGEQLTMAMQLINELGYGVLIYLRQEGRGIGLLQKLRAYNLQDQGHDTVDANLLLGHGADERSYALAARILEELGVHSVTLMTNNPIKITALEEEGIKVSMRLPIEGTINADNKGYLFTKVQRMDHLLPLDLVSPVHESQGVG